MLVWVMGSRVWGLSAYSAVASGGCFAKVWVTSGLVCEATSDEVCACQKEKRKIGSISVSLSLCEIYTYIFLPYTAPWIVNGEGDGRGLEFAADRHGGKDEGCGVTKSSVPQTPN